MTANKNKPDFVPVGSLFGDVTAAAPEKEKQTARSRAHAAPKPTPTPVVALRGWECRFTRPSIGNKYHRPFPYDPRAGGCIHHGGTKFPAKDPRHTRCRLTRWTEECDATRNDEETKP